MAIVTSTDFVGEFQISSDKFSKEKLDLYIARYENLFINRLLGCELAKLFIDDLDNGVPQDPKFVAIFEPFCKQDECGNMYESSGMKDMLIGMIYFEFVKNNNSYVSTGGNKAKKTENSKTAGSLWHNVYARWNLSVKTSVAIQWFICREMATYPEYEGIPFKINYWV